jgi:hypothetical protein
LRPVTAGAVEVRSALDAEAAGVAGEAGLAGAAAAGLPGCSRAPASERADASLVAPPAGGAGGARRAAAGAGGRLVGAGGTLLEACIQVSEEARRSHAVCQRDRVLEDSRRAEGAGLASVAARHGLVEADGARRPVGATVARLAHACWRFVTFFMRERTVRGALAARGQL